VEFSQASAAVSAHPWRGVAAFTATMLAHLLDILCLYVLFLAFGYRISPGPLVAVMQWEYCFGSSRSPRKGLAWLKGS